LGVQKGRAREERKDEVEGIEDFGRRGYRNFIFLHNTKSLEQCIGGGFWRV